MVLMPRTALVDARQAAERLRVAVTEIDCTDIAPTLRLSISVGLSDADRLPTATLDSLSQAADEALYRAKANGRNRVEWAAEPE